MARYHINKNGRPAICRAKVGNCPLGQSTAHFNSREDAQDYADKTAQQRFMKEHDIYPEPKNLVNTPYSVLTEGELHDELDRFDKTLSNNIKYNRLKTIIKAYDLHQEVANRLQVYSELDHYVSSEYTFWDYSGNRADIKISSVKDNFTKDVKPNITILHKVFRQDKKLIREYIKFKKDNNLLPKGELKPEPVDYDNFSSILKNHGIYYDYDEIKSMAGKDTEIQLTGKAYGDGYDFDTEQYFGEDYPALKSLAKKLKIQLPEQGYLD